MMNVSRSQSKERQLSKTSASSRYMSNEQFAEYLSDLRTNRVARPSGARPLPSKPKPSPRHREREPDRFQTTPAPKQTPVDDLLPRSMSAMSARRSQSALSHYNVTQRPDAFTRNSAPVAVPNKPPRPLKPGEVVPTATYMERGMRWMEKEEAVALRDAMEDLELKKKEAEEARIQAAAQKEATELVYLHTHPAALRPATDGPYRYKEHLRKHSYAKARTASIGPVPGIAPPTGLARDLPRSISVSSNERSSSRTTSDSSQRQSSNEPDSRTSSASAARSTERNRPSAGSSEATAQSERESRPHTFTCRRSAGRRNVSGEIKISFTGDQIWEEPEGGDFDRGRSTEEREGAAAEPLKAKTKPNRVSFVEDPPPRSESTPPNPTKKFYKKYISEIYKNPPSQSRNPAYTVNDNSVPTPLPEVPVKDGKEIRSDDIIKATSMRLSDRSSKLPTPTAVSDRPGRPIVSFDKSWTPAEEKVDMKAESSKPEGRAARGSPSPFDRSRRVRGGNSLAEKTGSIYSSSQTSKAIEDQSVKRVFLPEQQAGGLNGRYLQQSDSVIINVKRYSSGNVPNINLPDEIETTKVDGNVPTLKPSSSFTSGSGPSNVPSISVNEPSKNHGSVPSFSFSGPSESKTPEVSLSEPSSSPNGNVPTFSISEPEAPKPSIRAPMIAVSEPLFKPTASTLPTKSNPTSTRPLPDPRNVRPVPRTNTVIATSPPSSRGYWSPDPASSSRATTVCHQCNGPTERGAMRVSGQWFHPTCIRCHHCNQALGHMDISAEPEKVRSARLDRIARRVAGELIEENREETMCADGDERLRFYCHLDWHELFAPRCHHCKTPIESGQNYQTAMGNVYHQGHFFCGECGDPFFEGVPYVKVDGWPWCVSCATKRTERRAPKCRACAQPVVGEYTVALGGEWHLDCFRCVGCAERFGVEGKIFTKRNEESGAECAFCLACMEREWKA